jgi:hypothetical protein
MHQRIHPHSTEPLLPLDQQRPRPATRRHQRGG